MSRQIRLALTGFGNVGQGLAVLLRDIGKTYQDRCGIELLLTGVADRQGAAVNRAGLKPQELLDTKSRTGTVASHADGEAGLRGRQFLVRSGAEILIEAASTNFDDAEPGWSYACAAIDGGLDLVLASKGALVLHYQELLQRATRANRLMLFSGAIGAPLPILEMNDRVLVGANVTGFEGILNATSNHILGSMAAGKSYEEAVELAQQAGIAETDPTLDVDGWDAAAKCAIVANTLFGGNLALSDVARSGIRDLPPSTLIAATKQGQAVKLVASAARTPTGITAEVKLETRSSSSDVLGSLLGSEMGVVFHTQLLGNVTATVQEIGGVPTALTVLRDVVNVCRDRGWTSESQG